MIYNSLIVFHLNYRVLIWGYKCEWLTKLQKRIIRIISLGKYNSHSEPFFKSLKLLKLDDILKLQELKFYYKFENGKLPCYLSKLLFIRNTIIHGYDTRINHNIHLLKPNHEYAKKCIRNNIPLLVNNTPNNILEKIHTHSLQGFSTYVKHCYIESYNETYNIVNCSICMINWLITVHIYRSFHIAFLIIF